MNLKIIKSVLTFLMLCLGFYGTYFVLTSEYFPSLIYIIYFKEKVFDPTGIIVAGSIILIIAAVCLSIAAVSIRKVKIKNLSLCVWISVSYFLFSYITLITSFTFKAFSVDWQRMVIVTWFRRYLTYPQISNYKLPVFPLNGVIRANEVTTPIYLNYFLALATGVILTAAIISFLFYYKRINYRKVNKTVKS